MNGIEFFRRKNKLKINDLSQLSGVIPATISNLEHCDFSESTNCIKLAAIANALNVPVDMLLWEYDPSWLEMGDRGVYTSNAVCKTNYTEIYRRKKNLSFDQLAKVLKVSRQAVHAACKRSNAAPKHIDEILHYEGIGYEEFISRYIADSQ